LLASSEELRKKGEEELGGVCVSFFSVLSGFVFELLVELSSSYLLSAHLYCVCTCHIYYVHICACRYKAEEERRQEEADAMANGPGPEDALLLSEAAAAAAAAEGEGGVEAVLRRQRVGLLERLTQAEQRAKLWEGR
jgi:hypothetical protein